SDDVSYAADLRIGGSRGRSEGRVSFSEGFKIRYQTPSVSFSDVEDLSGLSFEGRASIEGETSGDSDSAIFDMKIRASDFVFERYDLGEVTGTLRYRRGH